MKILSILIFSVSIICSVNASGVVADAILHATIASEVPSTQPECASALETCRAAAVAADEACSVLNLDKYGLMISGALAASSVGGSITNSCAKMDEVMKIANAGMAAYQANCALKKNACTSACATAGTSIDKDIAKYNVASEANNMNPPAKAAAKASAVACGQDLKGQIKITSACEGLMLNLAAAAAGIVSIAAENDAAQNCKKKTSTTDCKTNSADPKCYVDCSMPEHASKAQCICQKTPNAKGCPGAVAYDAGLGIQTVGNTAETDLKIPNPNFDGGGSGFAPTPIGGGSASSGGGLGGSGGDSGGGGGADGFSGGGKGADASLKTGGKKMSTDILSGFDGGGGGGGGSRGGGRNADSPYNAYLPGGSKDPSRGLAAAGSAEVTAGGSKSNWEKIKERYQQFSPSLNAGP
jgi:hypothetical protein